MGVFLLLSLILGPPGLFLLLSLILGPPGRFFLRPYVFLVPELSFAGFSSCLCRRCPSAVFQSRHWFRAGSGMVRAMWFGHGSGMVRARGGSSVVRAWFGHGSGMVRASGGGSGMVRAWFGQGGSGMVRAKVVRAWFGHGSGMVRARGGCGFNFLMVNGVGMQVEGQRFFFFFFFFFYLSFFLRFGSLAAKIRVKPRILQENQAQCRKIKDSARKSRILQENQGQCFFGDFSGRTAFCKPSL